MKDCGTEKITRGVVFFCGVLTEFCELLHFLAKTGKKEKRRISELSRGQQIRQQLAFALSYDARVYVLDEPTGNLDVDFRDEFYRRIRHMVEGEDKVVVCASHLVEELETFADWILWLKRDGQQGSIRYYGSIDELRDRYRLVETERERLKALPSGMLLGGRVREHHQEFLVDVRKGKLPEALQQVSRYASLTEIMYYVEKGETVTC